jgi:hypothetical protein
MLKFLARPFTRHVPSSRLALFRVLYCTALIAITINQLAYTSQRYHGPKRIYYAPSPLLHTLGIGLPSARVTVALGVLLVIALALAAVGIRARLMLATSLVLFIGYYSIVVGWLRPFPTSTRVTFCHGLHPFVLLLLCVAPGINGWRLGLSRPHLRRDDGYVPRWPLAAIELALGLSYFGAFYAKLQDTGLNWADGYNLQTCLLDHYSVMPSLTLGLLLAQHHSLCLILSVGSLMLEALFWTVVVWPPGHRARWLYVAAGLSFHVMTWVAMGIGQFLFSYCAAYLVFIDYPRTRPTTPALPTAPSHTRGGLITIAGVSVVLLGAIIGRVNYWPLSDWSAFSTRLDYRTDAAITRCEVLEPGQAPHGCFSTGSSLYWPKPITVGTGSTVDDGVHSYVKTLSVAGHRRRPQGLALRLTVRDYAVVDGLLRPRFRTLDEPF